ncbi:MAG: DUF4041 domain-containing protein [Acidobacteria bacterium]|nr:DUF4041 domain-containing protein [Acidobacteriota bacterium]
MLTPILLISALAVSGLLTLLYFRFRKLNAEHQGLIKEHSELKDRVRTIVDIDAEKQRVINEIEALKRREHEELQAQKQQAMSEIEDLRKREVIEIELKRRQELGNLEADRTRLTADIEGLHVEQQRAAQQLQEQSQRAQVELEAINARAQEAQHQAFQTFQQQKQRMADELHSLQSNINRLLEEVKPLSEEAHLQSFGFYKPHYNFASSEHYQSALEEIREHQKGMIKSKVAAICRIEWTVDGSRAAGRKQTNQTLRLILRAFNGECDAAIAKVKYNNIHVMETRIRKAWETINSLVEVQQCQIVPGYLELKLKELYLVHEYQEKLQEEKEEQRRIREQMREEEIALRELERAQQEAEREEARYSDALVRAREEVADAVGKKQEKLLIKIGELEQKLAEAQANKARAMSRAQMTRSGHVYIISNIGSFGEQVFKIGMTRRLDPLDRVRELGDASVPFHFDVHAIIYSEDAPKLEHTLHQLFKHRRINRVNERREFFRVSIEEIADAVRKNHGEIEMVLDCEAIEYRKTLAILTEEQPLSSRQTSAADSGLPQYLKIKTL